MHKLILIITRYGSLTAESSKLLLNIKRNNLSSKITNCSKQNATWTFKQPFLSTLEKKSKRILQNEKDIIEYLKQLSNH